MAELLTTGQPARTAILAPVAVYSRVVSCSDNVTFGNPRGIYTVPLGERVWLLGVRLFWEAREVNHLAKTVFRVMTGMTRPTSAGDMRISWEDVLPKMGAGHVDASWSHEYGVTSMVWTMRMLYMGSARRFGVWMQIVMPGDAQLCQASFEISEG